MAQTSGRVWGWNRRSRHLRGHGLQRNAEHRTRSEAIGGPSPEDVISTFNDQWGHRHVKYASGVEVVDGSQILTYSLKPPKDGETGVNSDDYKAYVANGHQSVVVNPADMVRSTSGVMTEVTPPVTIPNCYSPPATFDLATASDADLAKYGFPPLPGKGMTRSEYNKKYEWMKHRVCTIRGSNGATNGTAFTTSITSMTHAANHTASSTFMRSAVGGYNSLWEGNVADLDPCGNGGGFAGTGLGCLAGNPNFYSEADMDFNVPCVANGGSKYSLASESAWIGLGGAYGTSLGNGDELIQTGSETQETNGVYTYNTWIEYVMADHSPGDGSGLSENPEPVNITSDQNNTNGSISCGTHIYTKVWSPDNYEIGNIGQQIYVTISNHGPHTAGATAEAISENNSGWYHALANYGWVTFKGIGTTVYNGSCPNGCYESFTNAEHDFLRDTSTGDSSGTWLQNIGSLVYDGADPPYDDYTISYITACGVGETCY